MHDVDAENARQDVVDAVLRDLHHATLDGEDYRTLFADLTRQLVDRMEPVGTSWRTPARFPRTSELMRTVVDPAVEAHSDVGVERRMAYADLFRKVSESVVCGVRHAALGLGMREPEAA